MTGNNYSFSMKSTLVKITLNFHKTPKATVSEAKLEKRPYVDFFLLDA